MNLLVLGLVLFLGIHLSSVVGLRDRVVERIGGGPWQGLYSLISLAGLVAIVLGYGRARMEAPVVIWMPPMGLRHATLALMLPVFPLLVAAYVPGRIKRWAGGHPMLLATSIWSGAHLLANGMLHDVLLFGGFFVWSVVVRISFVWRTQRPLPGAPEGRFNDLGVLALGLAFYGVSVGLLHLWLFGVSPLPV